MKRLLDFFNLLCKVEELERRIKTLEAYMQAEAHFRGSARDMLLKTDLPLQERLENALSILASYESASEAISAGGYLFYAAMPTVPNPVHHVIPGEGVKAHVVFYGENKSFHV